MNDDFDPSLLSGYLDDELTAAEREQVEQMLASDAALRDELAAMQRLQAAIAVLPLPASQTDLVAGVRDRIAAQQPRMHREDHAATPLSVLKFVMSFAVAACILFAIGWSLLPVSKPAATVAMDKQGDAPEQTESDQRGLAESAAMPSVAIELKSNQEADAEDTGTGDSELSDSMLQLQDAPAIQVKGIESAAADVSAVPREMKVETRAEPSLGLQADAMGNGAPQAMMMEAPSAATEPQARVADGLRSRQRPGAAMPLPAEAASGAAVSDLGRNPIASSAVPDELGPGELGPASTAVASGMQQLPAAPEQQAIRNGGFRTQPQSRTLQMQIVNAPNAKTVDAVKFGDNKEAADAVSVLVTKLSSDRIRAAIGWLQNRMPPPGANPAAEDATPRVPFPLKEDNKGNVSVLVRGSPAQLAQFEKDWSSYVRSIDGTLAKRKPSAKRTRQADSAAITGDESLQPTNAATALLIQLEIAK